MEEGVSVIMPVFNHAKFIAGAISSLLFQTFSRWELIIVNDGCTDETKEIIENFLDNSKIKYFEFAQNRGLGAAINKGLSEAQYPYIAYLPADDLFYACHLEFLLKSFMDYEKAVFVYSGLRYNSSINPKSHNTKNSLGKIRGYSLQMVQVMHKRTDDRWVERSDFVTEDLYGMFWQKLLDKGIFVSAKKNSCEWVAHPAQRHRMIWDRLGGGLNTYRYYYNVQNPLDFRPSGFNHINENAQYAPFRKEFEKAKDCLKILLVGELSYNPERIIALEERGHQLYGLWTDKSIYGMVGPVPFGNVKEISRDNPIEDIKRIKPDIIYGLLNFMAVPIAHKILKSNLDIPFVWHFKEGPFYCRQFGIWNRMLDLFTLSDGQIYTSQVMKDWFSLFLPRNKRLEMVLDGDLPKKDQFMMPFSKLLSEQDGEIHTVIPGRPMGIEPEDIGILAMNKIHFHFYGNSYHSMWSNWIEKVQEVAGRYFHTHPNCPPERWVEEFSQYDAGWLHTFESQNEGDLFKVDWNDMNIPARLTTLALSGVPVLQRDNAGHVVETQSIVKDYDIGLFFNDYEDLAKQLKNRNRMRQLRGNMKKNRMRFTFDHHIDDLISFFWAVIKERSKENVLD